MSWPNNLIYLTVIIIIIITTTINSVLSKPSADNSTSQCKQTITYTNNYVGYYPLAKEKNWTDSVRLNFLVATNANAHILLCKSPFPSAMTAVYEIVLGASGNTFSELRRLQKGDIKVSAATPGLLSSIERRKFWIAIYKDGLIEVGQNRTPILSWRDPNPIHVQYYSFSTWFGTYGVWIFDCPPDEADDAEEMEREEESNLTPKERLHRDLVHDHDTVSAPTFKDSSDRRSNVFIYLDILRLSLNVETSELSTIGKAVLEWNDDRFTWESKDYGDIDRISIDGYLTWKPNIVLINPIEHKYNKPFSSEGNLMIRDYGTVSWTPKADMHTFCDLNFQNWPWDVHICKIQMSVWGQQIILADTMVWNGNLMSEWLLVEESVIAVNIETLEYTYSHFAGSDLYYDNTLQFKLVIKRNTSFYHNLLFYLFIVASLLLLTAVCWSPFSTKKIALNCFCILLLSALLILTANSLPEFTQQTPTIVMAYSIMMTVASLYGSLCAFLTVLTKTKHESLPPECIMAILNNKMLSVLVFLQDKSNLQEAESRCQNNSRASEKCHHYDDANHHHHHHRGSGGSKRRSLSMSSTSWLKLASAIDNIISVFVLLITIFLINSF